MERKQQDIYILWTVGFKTAGFILVLCHLGIHIFIIRLAGMLRCFKMCKFWVHFQNWNKQKQKWYICLVFEHTIVNTGKSILHNMQSLTLTLTKHRSAVPSTDMLQKWFLPLQSLFFPIQLGIIFYLERSWPRWRWTCRCCHRCSCRRRWTSWSPEQAQSNLRTQGITLRLWATHI